MLYDKPYVCLPPNTTGRDFAIGAVQGHLETLQALLEAVDFDPLRDRLFSIGNLVDFAIESLDCLLLAEEPWFFPVLGTSEAFFLHELEDPSWASALFGDLRQWLEESAEVSIGQAQEILHGLPMALEVALADGTRVGLSHAGIPAEYHWDQVRQLERRPSVLTDCASRTLESGLLWSMAAGLVASLSVSEEREPFVTPETLAHEERWANRACTVPGIDLVISGFARMPLSSPVQFNNRLFLHGGTEKSGTALTLIQMGTSRCWIGIPPTLPRPTRVETSALTLRTDHEVRKQISVLQEYQKILARL